MSGFISVKLPATLVTIILPPITTTEQTTVISPSGRRVTRAGNVRVTRGGNTRVTHYSISSYPEIVAVKIDNSIITLNVP